MKKVILIADDSATIRKFLSFSLTMNNFEVISACDGMEAMEKLPMNKVDLVITDLNMPNMDGFELIRVIRANEEYADLPIIILSSLGEQSEVDKGLTIGANSYLIKPFDPKKVLYEIAKYLN